MITLNTNNSHHKNSLLVINTKTNQTYVIALDDVYLVCSSPFHKKTKQNQKRIYILTLPPRAFPHPVTVTGTFGRTHTHCQVFVKQPLHIQESGDTINYTALTVPHTEGKNERDCFLMFLYFQYLCIFRTLFWFLFPVSTVLL